jgi:ribosomal protein S4E
LRQELVKLYEFAQELDLEKITSTNDYELSQVNRRTITENGVTQVVCEIGQVNSKYNVIHGKNGKAH